MCFDWKWNGIISPIFCFLTWIKSCLIFYFGMKQRKCSIIQGRWCTQCVLWIHCHNVCKCCRNHKDFCEEPLLLKTNAFVKLETKIEVRASSVVASCYTYWSSCEIIPLVEIAELSAGFFIFVLQQWRWNKFYECVITKLINFTLSVRVFMYFDAHT